MNRRAFLRTAAGLLVAAPAIVRASSLMPVRPVAPWRGWVLDGRPHDDLVDALRFPCVDQGGLSFSRVLIADAATGRHIAWFDVDPPPGPGDTVTVELPTDGRLFVHSPA